MALWGFGRGRVRLNPAPAGWHRGEREVTAPQHTAHKTLSSGGEEKERKKASKTPRTAGQRGCVEHTLGCMGRSKHPVCVESGSQ